MEGEIPILIYILSLRTVPRTSLKVDLTKGDKRPEGRRGRIGQNTQNRMRLNKDTNTRKTRLGREIEEKKTKVQDGECAGVPSEGWPKGQVVWENARSSGWRARGIDEQAEDRRAIGHADRWTEGPSDRRTRRQGPRDGGTKGRVTGRREGNQLGIIYIRVLITVLHMNVHNLASAC